MSLLYILITHPQVGKEKLRGSEKQAALNDYLKKLAINVSLVSPFPPPSSSENARERVVSNSNCLTLLAVLAVESIFLQSRNT